MVAAQRAALASKICGRAYVMMYPQGYIMIKNYVPDHRFIWEITK